MSETTDLPAPEIRKTLLSYDASGSARAAASRVCQIIFGYEQVVQRNGSTKTYRHPGYLDRPGALWIGQSVFLFDHDDAASLARELQRLGVRVRRMAVRASRRDLAAFLRGR